MVSLIQFLFIVLVPVVLALGGLVSLFAVGALFDALENPGEVRKRLDGLFRPSPGVARMPAPDHYYRAHWRAS
jgi:hypothetical protein